MRRWCSSSRRCRPNDVAERGDVDRVRVAELLAAGAGRDDDRRAPVVGIGAAFDEPVGLHALHEPAEPGLAVARVHRAVGARPSGGDAAGAARSRYASAEKTPESMPASFVERGDDVVQHRLVHARRARSNSGRGSPARACNRVTARRGSSSDELELARRSGAAARR